MPTEQELCRAIGVKVRNAREAIAPKLSQTKLAVDVGVSRVSIVNIEGGRQRAPIYLLWRIAERLDIEPVSLVPRQDEFLLPMQSDMLDEKTVEEIREAAAGDPEARRQLTDFIGRIKSKST